jgi:hypothetical protein
MSHCGEFGYMLWATAVIWLYATATGHCGEFGYALRATEGDLVIRYGPLRGLKPYSKNL